MAYLEEYNHISLYMSYHGCEEEVFATHGSEVTRVSLTETADVEKTEDHRAWRYATFPGVCVCVWCV